MHGANKRKNHVCKICSMPFYMKKGLMKHIEFVHHDKPLEEGYDKCPSCDFRGKIGSVRMHYSRLHKEANKKTYVEAKRDSNPSLFSSSCKDCGMKFSNERNLKNHLTKCGSVVGNEKRWTLSWNSLEKIKSQGTITSP